MMEDKNNLPELPEGWGWTRLGEIIEKEPLTGKKLKQRDYQEKGKFPVIDQGRSFIGGYTDKEELKICSGEPVIVFGDHTKVVKYIDFEFAAGADGVKVIKPLKVFYPKLFYYFLQAIQLPEKGYARHFQFLEKSSIPLPPLLEQHRIVAKIEELFTKLDAGVEALKKIKTQLKRYRQSVLKSAMEGKLTKKWREEHKHELESAALLLEKIKEERKKKLGKKDMELPPVDTENLPKLPEGWCWTRLGNTTEIILGQSPPSSTYNEKEDGLPFYQGKKEFGYIYPIPQKWCTKPKKIADKGDVLISVRAPVGPTNICSEKSCIGRGLAAIRPLSEMKTFFILYLIRAFEHKLIGKHGTTFAAITGGHLKEFLIPLSSLPEQHKIVEEIERRFSVADEAEKVVELSLKQAERLRQSLLKKAFEGKLVPQDPTDEPANVLLERIKKEKERLDAERKTKRKSRKKKTKKYVKKELM